MKFCLVAEPHTGDLFSYPQTTPRSSITNPKHGLAVRALTVVKRQEVGIGADRLRDLRRFIGPRRNISVLAELDDRLAVALN